MAKYDIFISYSRKDTAIADKICLALDKYEITYFIDRHDVHGGETFPKILAQAILDCELFLLVASKNSFASKFTINEITFAHKKKSSQSLLPYIIDDSEIPIDFDFMFSSINWRNLFEHPIDPVLVNDLCNLLGKKPSPPTFSEIMNWYNLGVKHYEGKGTKKDVGKAAKWFRLAAIQGHADAQHKLGCIYEEGNGITRNVTEALKWYRLAAEQGIINAQNSLGFMYENGIGAPKDISEALRWYRLAAEQGDALAQYNLEYLELEVTDIAR